MESIIKDVQYGFRNLVKRPGYTAIALLTLALGIGANSAIFSVVNTVILRPFPFATPERLVVIWERSRPGGMPRMVVSAPNFADFRAQNQVFQKMAAYRLQDFTVISGAEPERVRGAQTTADMFTILGIHPVLGRDFQPDEDKPGTPAAAIVSYGFWQRHFGANSAVVGHVVNLNGVSTKIIGVMPADFDFPPPITFRGEARPVKVELWTQLPYALEQGKDNRGGHNLFVLARLKDGMSLENAQADLQTITQHLAHDFPTTNEGWDAFAVPLHQQVIGDVKTALFILPAAVLFVLLIACANVANLLLTKAAGRQREMALRAALGAGRFRLIRQILIESWLLSLFGGAMGLVFAAWALRLITSLAPQNIYRLDQVRLDGSVVIFMLLASLLTATLSGLFPAWQISKTDLVVFLREGVRASDNPARHRFRNGLVVTEIALALLLLTGAGLLVKSFIRLQEVPTGFNPDQLVAMTINLPRTSYPDRQHRLRFTEGLLPKLVSSAMLQSVAFSDNLPLDTGRQGTSFKIEGQSVLPNQEPHTNVSTVSPGYFQTMGIPLLQGRDFSAADKTDSPGVVIINSYLAHEYFGDQDPIGKRLDMGFRPGVWLQIIGVAADERHDTLQADLHPGMYLPYAQAEKGLPLVLLLRSAADSGAVASAVRRQVRELDPQLPVYDVKTMNQVLYAAVARPRFVTFLLVVFASTAVLLAVIGVYAVISYTVVQSTHDIGIRLALGARQSQILQLFVGRGLTLALIGVGIGLVGAFSLMRLMTTLLFGVTPYDAATFVFGSLGLIAIALVACYIPARRAAKVDPLVALRYE